MGSAMRNHATAVVGVVLVAAAPALAQDQELFGGVDQMLADRASHAEKMQKAGAGIAEKFDVELPDENAPAGTKPKAVNPSIKLLRKHWPYLAGGLIVLFGIKFLLKSLRSGGNDGW